MTFPVEILQRIPPKMKLAYLAYQPEVQAIRQHWDKIRKEMKANPLVEHNMLCREMHQTERDILGFLCPDLNSRDGQVKKRAIKWILKQPWGEDFKPAPIEKKFRGIELGSANSQSTG